MISRFAFWALFSWLALHTTARAELPDLVWIAPRSCPDQAAARALLARTLAPTSTTNRLSGARALRAEIVDLGREYRLDLTIESARGSQVKRLFAQRCTTFVGVIALELELSSAPAPAALPPRALPAAEPAVVVGARLSGGVGSGPTPDWGPRLGLSALLSRRRLRLALGVNYDLPREVHYPIPAQVGGRIDAFSAEARACYAFVLGPLELPLCGGVEAGAVRGRGLGITPSFASSSPWLALAAGPSLRVPGTGRFGFWLGFDALVGLVRPSFRVRNLPVLYRAPRFAVRGAAGVELRFE